MNTVDLRRTRRKGLACAAVAAFASLAIMPATAEVANPNFVPADSAYIISVPNTATAWSAWSENGLYGAFKKIQALPEVQEKSADFRKEMSIIESSLGFKLDGDTLSKIFSTADIYMQAPSSGSELDAVAILKVADADKANKLMDLAEKAVAKSAESDDSTSETETSDKSTSAVIVTDYNGVQIKSFKPDADGKSKFHYARVNDFLVASGDDASLKKAIDRIKANTAAADTFAGSEDFKKVDAALASEKGQLYVYGDQAKSNKLSGAGQMPAAISGPLQALVDDMAPISYYGASVKIDPKEVSSYSYALLKPGSENSLLVKNPGDKPLEVATYIPSKTLLGFATSLIDPQAIAKVITGISSSSSDAEKLSNQVEGMEAGMGFSLKNDLLPALGNQTGFSLSNVEFGGLIPSVDATILVGVKDKAKMTKVVNGLERLATNALAAKASDSETSAPEFQQVTVEGQTVKYLELPGLPNVAPGFVLTDDFLIIGSSKAALEGALKAHAGKDNLASGATLTALGHNISGNANMIQYANLGKILSVVRQITSAIPAAQPAGKYIDAASVLDASASASRVENGALVSHGVLKLK